jgi:hypothetical protein
MATSGKVCLIFFATLNFGTIFMAQKVLPYGGDGFARDLLVRQFSPSAVFF